jgi:hypothetical protein
MSLTALTSGRSGPEVFFCQARFGLGDALTPQELQKLRGLSMWDLKPYREMLQRGDQDGCLSAFLQRPANLAELPPDIAEHLKTEIKRYLCRIGQR